MGLTVEGSHGALLSGRLLEELGPLPFLEGWQSWTVEKGSVKDEQFRFPVDFEPIIAWWLRVLVLESGFLGANPGSAPYWQSDHRRAH